MAVADAPEHYPLDTRKLELRRYFGVDGYERWRKIYGSEKVSFIRRTVREGHNAMVAQALAWAWENGSNQRVLDAGCGPGLVSRALARAGCTVIGCDLAEQMVETAAQLAAEEPPEIAQRMKFVVSDLESIGNLVQEQVDLAICLDVLIYYPEDQFGKIMKHLTALTPNRLIFTYAPAHPVFKAMHRIGRLFPRGHRSTSMQIIGEAAVRRGLATAGLELSRQHHFSKGFYHVVLAEAIRR
ncbi:MAG: magnesium protoporphyrin IX methyltransferase [Chloroflexi bacterium]|uniref:Magnesium protoporphyrin IX methyltransferase n=1 Tax=Candidatus Chlorohelix allophototropha TaxID=3003348 RepID=A0A8T7M5E1_9CHLR|nr:magnesium protoporphyrin IX methyltransferase [Chloroflexota bacterium]WJW69212.1 magnesium protoporphyrin IX methyltransferase [Chloroflexota bacterium L227-S17]